MKKVTTKMVRDAMREMFHDQGDNPWERPDILAKKLNAKLTAKKEKK